MKSTRRDLVKSLAVGVGLAASGGTLAAADDAGGYIIDAEILKDMKKIGSEGVPFRLSVPEELMDDACFPVSSFIEDVALHPEKHKRPVDYAGPEREYCECCGREIDEDDWEGL